MPESWSFFLPFLVGASTALVLAAVFVRVRLNKAHRERELQAAEMRAEVDQARRELDLLRGEHQLALQQKDGELQLLRESQRARQESLQEREDILTEKTRRLSRREAALERLRKYYRRRLQRLAASNTEEVRETLREEVRRECASELQALREETLERTDAEIKAEARRVMLTAMQRLSSEPNHDITATFVKLPGEEMKGRIIGREGRNIRAFEAATGVTLMIDETPDSVLVSSFDPVRRETARLALEALVKDGRIHPSSIEETVAKAENEMKDNIIEFGERALRELRLSRAHPELLTMLGKMHYRLSNNQNSLRHSVEVAFFCSLIAAELGLDTTLAKRAGLFHDIGKVAPQDYEGSHAIVGAKILKRHGEDPLVVNAVAAHHGEEEPASAYAPIVVVADTLSAVRPGARADSMDGYIQRVRSLEALAREFEGVQDAFAVQAGREVRVIVQPETLDDAGARSLTRRIRNRVEEELQYPGTIKVTVIREQRFSETAH